MVQVKVRIVLKLTLAPLPLIYTTIIFYAVVALYLVPIRMSYYLPKTKKFGCVGRGDLTFLFKSCEIDKSQGDLSTNVEDNKSFTNRPSDLQNLCLSIILMSF